MRYKMPKNALIVSKISTKNHTLKIKVLQFIVLGFYDF